ncbi:hypothetical protein ACG83_10775 [Frankia sp. R43]|uniref:hypothetical protein n=1 Tax=Frankia sp. R43 TaxID=269536 RepID=UPI0006CA1478|nr:hypothetical protein [Frankia sp. R43]KPM55752.1 hypothetical protein ACG83_10775 [Frankia sp. R43]
MGERDTELEERPGRAVITLDEDTIAQLLTLPAGMRVAGVSADFMRMALLVLVESPDLPPVDPGCYPPELGGRAATEYLFLPEVPDLQGEQSLAEGMVRFVPDPDSGGPSRTGLWVRWSWRMGWQASPAPASYRCGLGWCEQPAALAFVAGVRRGAYESDARRGALLLCEHHADSTPRQWRDEDHQSAERGKG